MIQPILQLAHQVFLAAPNCINYSNGTRICSTVSVSTVQVGVIPDWITYGFFSSTLLAVFMAAFFMMVMYWLGPIGRRMIKYKGAMAFITYPDNTYDFQKVRRVAAFLRIKSKRYNTYAFAGEGTAFTRSSAPSFYLVDYRSGTAAQPKVVQYGEYVSGTEQNAGVPVNPDDRPKSNPQEVGELILNWYKEKLSAAFYTPQTKRELSLAEKEAMTPEEKRAYDVALQQDLDEEKKFADTKAFDQRMVDAILMNHPLNGVELTEQDKQEFIEKVASLLANEPRHVWPAWINGVVWDARRIIRWALSNFRPEDVQNIDIIARNEERIDQKGGTSKMILVMLGIVVVIVLVMALSKL